MQETVSIIMPAYNAQDFILRAVRSVLNQTYQDFELLIISDDQFNYKSFLESKKISDKRIRFLSTGKIKSGIAHTRNIGMEAAGNKLIAVLDSDDTFMPRKLEIMVPKAIAYGVVTCAVNYMEPEDSLITVFGDNPGKTILNVEEYPFINFATSSMLVIDKKKIPLKWDESYTVMEDFIFVMSCYDYVNEIAHIPQALHNYYFNPQSISNETKASDLFVNVKGEIIKHIDSNRIPVKNKKAQSSMKKFLQMSLDSEIKFSKLKEVNKDAKFIVFLKEVYS